MTPVLSQQADRWIVDYVKQEGHCSEGYVHYCSPGTTTEQAWEAALKFCQLVNAIRITHITVMPKGR